jgi:hypothetical protein
VEYARRSECAEASFFGLTFTIEIAYQETRAAGFGGMPGAAPAQVKGLQRL